MHNVHFADVQNGWAVGLNRTILATTDAGANWQVQNSGTDKSSQRAVCRYAPRLEASHRNDGLVLATTDGGANGFMQKSATEKTLFGLHIADAATGWAVSAAARL